MVVKEDDIKIWDIIYISVKSIEDAYNWDKYWYEWEAKILKTRFWRNYHFNVFTDKLPFRISLEEIIAEDFTFLD